MSFTPNMPSFNTTDDKYQIVYKSKDIDTSKAFKQFIESFEQYSQEWLQVIFANHPEVSLKTRFTIYQTNPEDNEEGEIGQPLYTDGMVQNKTGCQKSLKERPRPKRRIMRFLECMYTIITNSVRFLVHILGLVILKITERKI